MSLQSKLFRGDPKLEAAAVSDPAHITLGASGPHVQKIQTALILLDGAAISTDAIYGSSTASAVLAYKQKRNIINRSYQTQADNIVGKMTMASLDAEMLKLEARPPPVPPPVPPLGPVRIRPLSHSRLSPPHLVNFAGVGAIGGPPKIGPPISVMEIPPFGVGTFEVINAVGGKVVIDGDIATISDPTDPSAKSTEGLEVRQNPHLFNVQGKIESGTTTITAKALLGDLTRSFANPFGSAFLQVKVGLPAAAKEMNLVGKFEWVPRLTDDELRAELAAGRWSPSTDDFIVVPGGTVAVVPTFGTMLGAIFTQPNGSISRLNLFTHANKDLIGFNGRIEKRTLGPADVFMDTNSQGDNLTAMDPTSMSNLNQPGVFFEIGTGASKKKVTVAEIRNRFAANAMIVLYACHTGQLASFIKSVATFFNVKVVGFTVDVAYFPPSQTVPGRFVRTGMKIGLRGGTAVPDFRTLINDAKAVTATP